MQTFLPFADYAKSASVLDRARLGKQRVETLQIGKAILLKLMKANGGYMNHPATLMWWNGGTPFLPALIQYGEAMIAEWVKRGYVSNMTFFLLKEAVELTPHRFRHDRPVWDEQIHVTHRARLLQKDYDYYKIRFDLEDIPFGWEDMTYDWSGPTNGGPDAGPDAAH